MVQTSNTTPDIMNISFLILKILGLFVALLVSSILIVPKYFTENDYGNLKAV